MAYCLSLAAALLLLMPAICGAGQLAVIIDDIGYNSALGRRTTDLDGAFTLAILPFTPHGVELAQRANARGKELILHTPMSNNQGQRIEQGALESGMTHEEFVLSFNRMLADIPYISGVNNHMGSRLTGEQQPMDWLMSELARRHLYFIDSRTTAETLALQTAQQHRIPSAKRDVFLDNQRAPALIEQQLRKAMTLARKQGFAIAIGHPYPETLTVLKNIQPLLDEYQVELIKVSTLLAGISGAAPRQKLSCPAPPVLLWRPLTPDSTSARRLDSAYIDILVMKSGLRHANSIYPIPRH